MNKVSFPYLGLEFKINKIAFNIFGFPIYWYALIITCGIVCAYLYTLKEGKRQGISSDVFSDILIIGIPSAVVGARAYYVLFNFDEFKYNLISIFNLRGGGIAIYGAIIASVISVFIYLRIKKLNILPVFDICSVGLLIGQSIGRWGNFVNQEAFGTNTTLPWGMTSEDVNLYLNDLLNKGINIDPNAPVHPIFLYESLWNLLGVFLLSYLIKRKKEDGQIFFLYIIWYGFGRFFIEGLRTDSLMIPGTSLRISQVVAFVSFAFGVFAYIFLLKKSK